MAHEADRDLVVRWVRGCQGPVIDAGCGPGQWTDFLRQWGVDVEGVDVVPEFLAEAVARFPAATFRLATLDDLGVGDRSVSGVLCWYSLIHTAPEHIGQALGEFARCLIPGGGLLLGFFEGPKVEPFAHAVTMAYRWPVDELACHVENAGFVVQERHTRSDPGVRPHGALTAVRQL
nr:class I SAM-dependent methyltransferase [Phytoactinopolyspora halophila]